MTTTVTDTDVNTFVEAYGFHGQLLVNRLGEFKTVDREITTITKYGIISRTQYGKAKKLSLHKKTGYYEVRLQIDGVKHRAYAHRVVLMSFQPNSDSLLQTNHKDLDKSNNTLDNLEWITASENVKHAWDSSPEYKANRNAKRNSTQGVDYTTLQIKSLTTAGFTIKETSELMGISTGTVSQHRLRIK